MLRLSLLLLLQALLGANAAVLLLGGELDRSCAQTPAVRRSACLEKSLLLRGGADDLEDELDEEDDGADVDEDADAALENPFLTPGGAAAAGGGLPGAGMGMGIDDLASSLKDPQALQDALKELQDPAIQAQVKAMLEDPAFQESMKSYMDQITKDPQFEEIKKQTEAMLQEEGFVENMQKAFANLGGAPPGMPGLTGGDKEEEE